MAYVVKSIPNHPNGTKRLYLYEQYRENGKVVSKYIRPAASKQDRP